MVAICFTYFTNIYQCVCHTCSLHPSVPKSGAGGKPNSQRSRDPGLRLGRGAIDCSSGKGLMACAPNYCCPRLGAAVGHSTVVFLLTCLTSAKVLGCIWAQVSSTTLTVTKWLLHHKDHVCVPDRRKESQAWLA